MDVQNKRKLKMVIRGLIGGGFEGTQEDLRLELRKHGFKVTQSTISRTLKQLGVVKGHELGKPTYRIEESPRATRPVDDLAALVRSIESNESLIVVKTAPGSAMFVAGFVDHHCAADILGTVAGDDTIFVAPRTTARIGRHADAIRSFLIG